MYLEYDAENHVWLSQYSETMLNMSSDTLGVTIVVDDNFTPMVVHGQVSLAYSGR